MFLTSTQILDVSGNIEESKVEIELVDSANAKCWPGSEHFQPQVIVDAGELLETIVDVWEITGDSTVIVNQHNSANAHTDSSNVILRNGGVLMRGNAIDQSEGSCSSCHVTVAASGDILGGC